MNLDLIPFDEVAEFHSGGTPSRDRADYYSGETPWITGADIDEIGSIRARYYITERAIEESSTGVAEPGDLLIVTRTNLGKVAIVTDGPVCFSQDITAVRLDMDRVDIRYLWHYIRSQENYFASRARGATIKGVTRDVIRRMVIPLTSLTYQRRIAQVLDRIDSQLSKRRKAISLLDELAQSIFLDMFGNPDTSWQRVKVSDLARDAKGTIRTGPFGSQLLHEEFVESGIAVIGIDNAVQNEFSWNGRRFITEEKFGQLARYQVYPGDVLITIMGTCGRCAVVPDDVPVAINTKHLCCITLDQEKCLPEFLHAFFLMHPDAQKYLRRTAKGAIMSGLNMGIIKNLPVVLPPLALQQKFVDRVKALKNTRSSARAHLVELDALFASLQDRAFRGELWTGGPLRYPDRAVTQQ